MIKTDIKINLITKIKQEQKELMTKLKLGKTILHYTEILHQVLGLINGIQDGNINLQVEEEDILDTEEHQMKFMQDLHLELISLDKASKEKLNSYILMNQETKMLIMQGLEKNSEEEKQVVQELTLIQQLMVKFLITEQETQDTMLH